MDFISVTKLQINVVSEPWNDRISIHAGSIDLNL